MAQPLPQLHARSPPRPRSQHVCWVGIRRHPCSTSTPQRIRAARGSLEAGRGQRRPAGLLPGYEKRWGAGCRTAAGEVGEAGQRLRQAGRKLRQPHGGQLQATQLQRRGKRPPTRCEPQSAGRAERGERHPAGRDPASPKTRQRNGQPQTCREASFGHVVRAAASGGGRVVGRRSSCHPQEQLTPAGAAGPHLAEAFQQVWSQGSRLHAASHRQPGQARERGSQAGGAARNLQRGSERGVTRQLPDSPAAAGGRRAAVEAGQGGPPTDAAGQRVLPGPFALRQVKPSTGGRHKNKAMRSSATDGAAAPRALSTLSSSERSAGSAPSVLSAPPSRHSRWAGPAQPEAGGQSAGKRVAPGE